MEKGLYVRPTILETWIVLQSSFTFSDYRRLKKRIKAIRWAQEGYFVETVDSPIGSKHDVPLPDYDCGTPKEPAAMADCPPHAKHAYFVDTRRLSYCSCTAHSQRESDIGLPDNDDDDKDDDHHAKHVLTPPGIDTPVRASLHPDAYKLSLGPDARTKRATLLPQIPAGILEKARRELNRPISFKPSFMSAGPANSFKRSPDTDFFHPMSKTLPLKELLPLLSPLERSFFEILDEEMEKVEAFYVAREAEMRKRGRTLEDQLTQLSAHRPSIVCLSYRIGSY